MDGVTIGLWVSGGMLVMVVLGMRVAFAAGLAGFVGLVWLRWNGFDYDPNRLWKAVQISVKVAGLTPHSKVSAQVLSL
ncbi:MAG: TRAP transporter large permease, partial [Rhodobacteraceae bacterium]|nr:TRAP transporter large permease [Paracoccaceae bacterium]